MSGEGTHACKQKTQRPYILFVWPFLVEGCTLTLLKQRFELIRWRYEDRVALMPLVYQVNNPDKNPH